MIKTSLLTLAILMTSSSLFSDDTYIIKYSKDSNCTLTKNGKNIPFLDPKFGEVNPNYGYTCTSVQKEQYNKCTILKSKNVSALMFAYGSFEFTNSIIAVKNPHSSVDTFIKVKCTKDIPKD